MARRPHPETLGRADIARCSGLSQEHSGGTADGSTTSDLDPARKTQPRPAPRLTPPGFATPEETGSDFDPYAD